MKLKKIASLALAGVMAVSMLTACGSNAIDEQPPVDNGGDTTPATGYSAIFEDRLSAKSDANISMSDSADLNNALKAALEFSSDAVIADRYDEVLSQGKVYFVDHESGTAIGQISTELINKADSDKESFDHGNEYETVKMLNPGYNSFKNGKTNPIAYDKKDADIVMLYVVTGVNTKGAVMEVAERLDDDIDDLVRVYNSNGVAGTGETLYNYTGSVSAETITLDADHGKSMTFVAVEIVRELV